MEERSLFRRIESFFPLNDIEVSKEVENLLKNEGNGMNFYLYANEIPLFVGSNWETIDKRILGFGGNLKIAVYNHIELPNLLLKPRGLGNIEILKQRRLEHIEIYKLNKPTESTRALFYDSYEVFSKKNKRFFLTNLASKKTINEYQSFFEQAKTELERINIEDCFQIIE